MKPILPKKGKGARRRRRKAAKEQEEESSDEAGGESEDQTQGFKDRGRKRRKSAPLSNVIDKMSIKFSRRGLVAWTPQIKAEDVAFRAISFMAVALREKLVIRKNTQVEEDYLTVDEVTKRVEFIFKDVFGTGSSQRLQSLARVFSLLKTCRISDFGSLDCWNLESVNRSIDGN